MKHGEASRLIISIIKFLFRLLKSLISFTILMRIDENLRIWILKKKYWNLNIKKANEFRSFFSPKVQWERKKCSMKRSTKLSQFQSNWVYFNFLNIFFPSIFLYRKKSNLYLEKKIVFCWYFASSFYFHVSSWIWTEEKMNLQRWSLFMVW